MKKIRQKWKVLTLAVMAFGMWASVLQAQTPDTNFPTTNGEVTAIAQDGTYVYIGGTFTQVNGNTFNRICRFNATSGAVDNGWNPNANNSVDAIVVSGNDILVGGQFTNIGGQAKTRLAKLNNTNGNAEASWTANANGRVYGLAVSGTDLYVAGDFNQLGSATRENAGKVAISDATVDGSWNPNLDALARCIEIDGSDIYIGGDFTDVNSGTTRNRVAKFNNSNGNADASWNPNVNDPVKDIAITSSHVYLAGDFTQVNGATARNRLAKFDKTNGNVVSAWNPNPNHGFGLNLMESIVVTDDGIYVGGRFTLIGGGTRYSLARLNDTNGNLDAGWTANTNGTAPNVDKIFTILETNGNLYVGGEFTEIAGNTTRDNFAAFLDQTPTWDGTGWAPAAPGATEDAIIAGDYNNDGDIDCASLTINNGVTMTISSDDINVSGNWTNNGTFTQTGGTVTFDGSAAQTITGNTSFFNLTINNTGGDVTISGSSEVTVERYLHLDNGDLVTSSGNTLVLDATATRTALVHHDGGDVTGDFVTVRQFLQNGFNGVAYRHLSSPVNTGAGIPFSALSGAGFSLDVSQGATFNADRNDPSLTSSNFPNLFTYVTDDANPEILDGWHCPAATENFAAGEGVAVRINRSDNAGNSPIALTGELNNGNVTVAVQNPNAFGPNLGWNLLGNPYAAPLNIQQFLSDNNTIFEATAYVFESSSEFGGAYATRTSAGAGTGSLNGSAGQYLAVGQGFFARANGDANAQFNNAQRLTNPATASSDLLRTEDGLDPDYQGMVRLIVTNQADPNKQSEVLLTLHPNATAHFDNGYEARLIQYNPEGWPTALFQQEENGQINDFVIEAMPAAQEEDEVITKTLKVWAGTSGTYTISATEISHFAEGATVILEDKELGVTHFFNANPTYTVVLEEGWHGDRFVIRLQNTFQTPTALDEASVDQPFTISGVNQAVNIQFAQSVKEAEIQVLEVSGKLLAEVSVSQDAAESISLPVGDAASVIVRIKTNDAVYTSKLLMNNQ